MVIRWPFLISTKIYLVLSEPQYFVMNSIKKVSQKFNFLFSRNINIIEIYFIFRISNILVHYRLIYSFIQTNFSEILYFFKYDDGECSPFPSNPRFLLHLFQSFKYSNPRFFHPHLGRDSPLDRYSHDQCLRYAQWMWMFDTEYWVSAKRYGL